MNFKNTNINGLILIKPKIYDDTRGYFFESYVKSSFEKNIKKKINFIQENISLSKKNTLRGLHFQNKPYMQNKLLKVLNGTILDVCVDLRKKSSTFLEVFKIVLKSDNHESLFIPSGIAHGFIVKSKTAKVSYFVDKPYSKVNQNGLIYNDKHLNINWNVDEKNIILSKKDIKLKNLKELKLI